MDESLLMGLRFMDMNDSLRIWNVVWLLLSCMSHCFSSCVLVVELREPRLFISMAVGARLGGARIANTWQGRCEPYSPITQGQGARGKEYCVCVMRKHVAELNVG